MQGGVLVLGKQVDGLYDQGGVPKNPGWCPYLIRNEIIAQHL